MRIVHKPSEPISGTEIDPTLTDLMNRPLERWSRRYVIAAALVLAHTLGFLSSLDALMSTRTSQGTIAWMISLNTFPYVAVPAYWVFGRTKFQGYTIGRRAEDSELYDALGDKLEKVHPYRVDPSEVGMDFGAIERLAKMPMVGRNRVDMLIDGEQTFDSIFRGIEAAERYLLVQFYIVRDDDLGRELSRRLQAKVREGVRVFFLYDEIGSYRLPSSYLEELREAGVEVRRFHSTRGFGNRFQINFRNHRKVVVADGRVGWLGGLNVGDEYMGLVESVGRWRDTYLRVEGPATLCLQLSFVEDWHWATEQIPELEWEPATASDADVPVLVLPSGPADRFETASLMVQHAANSARERLWISSPYFVPDEGVLAALKIAALRGVDVRVLIPERPDNILAYFAAYAFIGPLLEAGVSVYRYHAGVLHAKTLLVDGGSAAVGTVNLDNRSFRLNFELTAWVHDPGFAAEMETVFLADFDGARAMSVGEVDSRPWWFRALSRAAYLTAPAL